MRKELRISRTQARDCMASYNSGNDRLSDINGLTQLQSQKRPVSPLRPLRFCKLFSNEVEIKSLFTLG